MTEAQKMLTIERTSLGLRVAGDIDAHAAPQLKSALADASATPAIELDVSGVTFIDSSGLRVLVAAHKSLPSEGRELILVDPSPSVLRLLEITELIDHLTISTST